MEKQVASFKTWLLENHVGIPLGEILAAGGNVGHKFLGLLLGHCGIPSLMMVGRKGSLSMKKAPARAFCAGTKALLRGTTRLAAARRPAASQIVRNGDGAAAINRGSGLGGRMPVPRALHRVRAR